MHSTTATIKPTSKPFHKNILYFQTHKIKPYMLAQIHRTQYKRRRRRTRRGISDVGLSKIFRRSERLE